MLGEGHCTRNSIRDVLVEAQLLKTEFEDIRAISLVIGGTKDQLIHHDVLRDFVCWSDTPELDKEKESNFARVQLGSEHNRIAYNVKHVRPKQYPHSNGERKGRLSSWNTEDGPNQPRFAHRKVFHKRKDGTQY